MISNKIADKIMKASRNSPQNNLETVTNETENIEVPKERYISTEKDKIIESPEYHTLEKNISSFYYLQ